MIFWAFWLSVATLLYTYILFPVLIVLRGWLWPKPYRTEGIIPTVTVIIAAHNEAAGIGAKLDNLLALDYPAGKLEVIVASDGSNDGTNSIVAGYAEQGIRLMALPRLGKADALNAAVATAQGEILVFSDANSMYAPDALRALVRPFADPTVGGVAGDQRYVKNAGSGTENEGERSYWKFDRLLKEFESRAGNTISATGAIYATRRSLFRPIPVGVTDDFTNSTGIIAQGHRLVFAGDAVAYEPVSASETREYGRKVRVITRGLQAVILRRRLMNPFEYGFYALQLFSHKLLRRLAVFPLLVLLFVTPFLWARHLFYRLAVLGQILFYGFALLGHLFRHKQGGWMRLLRLPYYFCMVNLACLQAVINVIRGNRIVVWETQRPVKG